MGRLGYPMEEGLLSPNGEYDLHDIYKAWNLGQHWIIWRQCLLSFMCHCFTGYGFYMATICWPPQLNPLFAAGASWVALMTVVLMLVYHGRKKIITYGFLAGGISGVFSAMITNQLVALPPVVILCSGLLTPVVIPLPDEWEGDSGSLVVFTIVCMVRYLAYMACGLAGVLFPPVGWQVPAVALVGSSAAIGCAMLVHAYMLQSPLEILGGCDGFGGTDMDMDQRRAIQQEKAIEALRVFAEATGRTLPENLKSLKKVYEYKGYRWSENSIL